MAVTELVLKLNADYSSHVSDLARLIKVFFKVIFGYSVRKYSANLPKKVQSLCQVSMFLYE